LYLNPLIAVNLAEVSKAHVSHALAAEAKTFFPKIARGVKDELMRWRGVAPA
jgi:hypothetical protein